MTLQQRDCSGFAPDSLLVRNVEALHINQYNCKGTLFLLKEYQFVDLCVYKLLGRKILFLRQVIGFNIMHTVPQILT